MLCVVVFFFFSSRRRHTRLQGDWSSDVCSSDLSPFVSAPVHLPTASLARCAKAAPYKRTIRSGRTPRPSGPALGCGAPFAFMHRCSSRAEDRQAFQPPTSISLSALGPRHGFFLRKGTLT